MSDRLVVYLKQLYFKIKTLKQNSMLIVNSTTVTQESVVDIENTRYSISHVRVNDVTRSIKCTILRKLETSTQMPSSFNFSEVGQIRRENGQINSNILESEDFMTHYMQFAEIIKELEKKIITEIEETE